MNNVVGRGKLTIQHCPALNMSDDYLTKPLQGEKNSPVQKRNIGYESFTVAPGSRSSSGVSKSSKCHGRYGEFLVLAQQREDN